MNEQKRGEATPVFRKSQARISCVPLEIEWEAPDNRVPSFLASCGTTRCNIPRVQTGVDAPLSDLHPEMDPGSKVWHPSAFDILLWLIQLYSF